MKILFLSFLVLVVSQLMGMGENEGVVETQKSPKIECFFESQYRLGFRSTLDRTIFNYSFSRGDLQNMNIFQIHDSVCRILSEVISNSTSTEELINMVSVIQSDEEMVEGISGFLHKNSRPVVVSTPISFVPWGEAR